MAKVVCFGELLLRFSAPGRERLMQSHKLDVFVGGAEANVAAGLARFGHAVDYVSIVADNALGHAALGELRRHGVNTASAKLAPGRMGTFFLEIGAIQRPSQIIYDRAGSAFAMAEPGAIDWASALTGAGRLHMSGITPALGERGTALARHAVAAAHDAGVPVSFDGNYRPSLWAAWDGDAPAILHELVDGADILFGDHRDLSLILRRELADFDEASAAAFTAFPNLKVVAATSRTIINADQHSLSARLATRDGATVLAGPAEVGPIVDRIGGGDAFAVGILHGLLTGKPPAEAVRWGLATTSLKHSVPGDLCVVDLAEVEGLLADQALDVRR